MGFYIGLSLLIRQISRCVHYHYKFNTLYAHIAHCVLFDYSLVCVAIIESAT